MTHAVFTASESSAYDDRIEERYHFPSTYLRAVEAVIGDLIIYYEPRRTSGSNRATGRSAYFACARVLSVDPDQKRQGHFYARLGEFIEFDHAVPFSQNGYYYESILRKEDGSTNKGAFGRSVRSISHEEFDSILRLSISSTIEAWEPQDAEIDSTVSRTSEGEAPFYVERSIVQRLTNRVFRDVTFRRHVRNAYENPCSVTGLRLINGGGRPEVQAAHICPVEANGPDTVRNGIALTGTAHWLFDPGLISISPDYEILVLPHGVPGELDRLIFKGHRLILPKLSKLRPHQAYLEWDRKNHFKL
ncbi:HNH endonuclease [Xanthomonas sacchari]